MTEPVKVGIIGTGIFAYRHLRAYAALGQERFQIVACANRSKEKAEKFAKEAGIPESAVYDNPEALINDPNVQVVDVLLPVQFNREIVKAAIKAKKHVMIEKPIAANLHDAQQIVAMAREAKTVVAVAENWAYHPHVRAAADYIVKGGIGKIINFTYDSARPYNPNSPYHSTSWRQNPLHPGGYLSDGCVHDLAHLIPILGRVDSISAFTTKTHKIHVVEDTLATTMRLENGAVGVANFTFCTANVKRMHLEVHGTEGTLRLTNDGPAELLDAEGKVMDTPNLNTESKETQEDVEGELDCLYNAVRNGSPLGITPEEAFHHLAIVVAALDAANNERVAKVAGC